MMKIFAVTLFAVFASASAASAGGGAEPVPLTNYTDLPPYHPMLACRTKRSCAHPWRYRRVYDYWTPR
jgi:hypothetical protein